MKYIRNIFKQDLRDGKQIAFPKEVSNIFFSFNYSTPDPDKKISFKYYEGDSGSSFNRYNGTIIKTRLYAAGSESRIDGELKKFLRDTLKAQIGDILVFTPSREVNSFVFEFIPTNSVLYASYKTILSDMNHEVLFDQLEEEQTDNIEIENIDIENNLEPFTDWFILKNGINHNYFSDAFSSDREKLIQQLAQYEEIYKKQFGTPVFSFVSSKLKEFIQLLETNLYLDDGDFSSYSRKTSHHMPRAILGKNNYLRFLHELVENSIGEQIPFNSKAFYQKTTESGLTFRESIINRFVASLCAKPFIILTGLSGSGKTKLAQAFVEWICEDDSQYRIIPVGADWTNREPLLGYPNGLNTEEYVLPDSGALQVLIEANKPENHQKPYFLVLDEMNLSHVERYFADFLSVMETEKAIKLYDGSERKQSNKSENGDESAPKVPKEIKWPKNLFIIGTVNVDETTYMFSPKVLDRANVIEFRVDKDDMKGFLDGIKKPEMKYLHHGDEEKNPGLGANMAGDFLDLARNSSGSKTAINSLNDFFPELQKASAEFGYRSAYEINRLVGMLESLAGTEPEWDGKKVENDDFIDIAIIQKLLPKLHGSRTKLVPVLVSLAKLCIIDDENKYADAKDKDNKLFIKECLDNEPEEKNVKYRISFGKIKRMYKNVLANGFTSYAEA